MTAKLLFKYKKTSYSKHELFVFTDYYKNKLRVYEQKR
jgi:hypothetical protein